MRQRLLEAAELRQRIAEIGARAEEARLERQHALERGDRFGRAVELEQHVAADVERRRSCRAPAPAPCRGDAIASSSRLSAESVRPRLASTCAELGLSLSALVEQHLRRRGLAGFELEQAREMQRVEPVRRRLQDARADLVGVVEPALPVVAGGLVHRAGDARPAMRRSGPAMERSDQRTSSSSRASACRAASRCSSRIWPDTMRSAVTSTSASSV